MKSLLLALALVTALPCRADLEVMSGADRPMNVLIPNPPMGGRTNGEFTVEWRLECTDQGNLRSIGNPAAVNGCLQAQASFKQGNTPFSVQIDFPGVVLYNLFNTPDLEFANMTNQNCVQDGWRTPKTVTKKIGFKTVTSIVGYDYDLSKFYKFTGSDAPTLRADGTQPPWRLEALSDPDANIRRPAVIIRAVTDKLVSRFNVTSSGSVSMETIPVRFQGFNLRQYGVPATNGGYNGTNNTIQHERQVVGSVNAGLYRIHLKVHGAALPGQRAGMGEANGGKPCVGAFSPLMLFFDDQRPRFSGGSQFPLSPLFKNITWPEPQAPGYFLAVDRDGNGKIEKAGELFGTGSLGDKPNGFEVLKEFDTDKNLVIDARDKRFHSLLLWQDHNGDGVSQPGELWRLSEKKVLSISLKYRGDRFIPLDTAELRDYAFFKFRDANGKLQDGTVIDVWFFPNGRAPATEAIAQTSAE